MHEEQVWIKVKYTMLPSLCLENIWMNCHLQMLDKQISYIEHAVILGTGMQLTMAKYMCTAYITLLYYVLHDLPT